MSETTKSSSNGVQLKKYCTDGKMEEGGIGKIKVRKTSTADADANGNGEKRKWPMLCDTNPYIVDLWKNFFNKKEETAQQEPDQTD